MGQLCKLLDRELVASVPPWKFHKHTLMTHLTLFLMHDWNYIPRVGIQRASLKACRRWDSTCHRMMTIAQNDEPLALLDSGHRDSGRVALYSRSMHKG